MIFFAHLIEEIFLSDDEEICPISPKTKYLKDVLNYQIIKLSKGKVL